MKIILKNEELLLYVQEKYFEKFKHYLSVNGYCWINGKTFQPEKEDYHPYYLLKGEKIARISTSFFQENINGKNRLSFGVMIGEENEKNCNQ